MVDFRGNKAHRGNPPRNYLARREQFRLLMLVVSLGLVVMLMSIAAKPSTWAWLTGQGARDVVQERTAPEEYDTRLRPSSDEELPLDVFTAPVLREEKTQVDGDFFPGVHPEYFLKVQDDTPFRHAENKAFFHLFDLLNRNDARTLTEASTGRVSFIQIFEQPDVYRGKLVTLHGVVKRSFDLTPPKNEYGIESYYQVWLQPDDGPNSPIVFYLLELPDGFPTSRTEDGSIRGLHEKVTITGFYYRNWAYAAGPQILTAPLVVAKTVEWHKEMEPVREPVKQSHIALAIAGTALVGIAVAVWVYWSSTQRAVPKLSALGHRYQIDSLRDLEDEDLGPNVFEALGEIAQREKQNPDGQTDV